MTYPLPTRGLVAAAQDVGSERLAAALAEGDSDEIARALRLDWVVVPLVGTPVDETPPADPVIRIFVGAHEEPGPSAPSGSRDLMVFSSTAQLAAFLGDDPGREFDIVRGRSLTGFLRLHADRIDRVVIDAASPHAVAAPTADVLDALRPRDDDARYEPTPLPRRPDGLGLHELERLLDLRLPLTHDWFDFDLTAPDAEIDARLRDLLKQQLAPVGVPASSPVAVQLRHWLRRTLTTARAGRGRELAFLVRRERGAALALVVTRYWQPLGRPSVGRSHLDDVLDRIRTSAPPRDGDESAAAAGVTQTAAGPFVRHVHLERADAAIDADRHPLLVIDYWLLFPDGLGLCLVGFSTPHVDLRDTVLRLTDQLVLNSAWLVAAPAEGAAEGVDA